MADDESLFFFAAVVGLAEAECCEADKGRPLTVSGATATAAAGPAWRRLCPLPCEQEESEDDNKDKLFVDDSNDDEVCRESSSRSFPRQIPSHRRSPEIFSGVGSHALENVRSRAVLS